MFSLGCHKLHVEHPHPSGDRWEVNDVATFLARPCGCGRRCVPCCSGNGSDRNSVVARHGRRTRPEGRCDRGRLQRHPEGLQDRPHLQGQLHRDDDGGDRRVPRQAAPPHRSGFRGRHRDADGSQGCGLSRLSAHEGSRAGLRSERLSAECHRLLQRQRRQHAVDAVQQLDAGDVLQQDTVQEGRA